ncbi:MAG: hypothetical protein JNG83_14410 [Opitutaceae bacterium]|nr:hypothetical protein [Opitutaceae bacterium]
MRTLSLPFLLIALFAALLAGCSSGRSTVVGLRFELTGVEQAADGSTKVSWRVLNPNLVAYLLAEGTHRITLDGVPVGTFKHSTPIGVPAQNQSDNVATLETTAPSAAALAAAASRGRASYRLESQIVVRLFGDNIQKATFHNAGEVAVAAK